ncbi:MAG: hypothetical protein V1742_04510, partial [Pseudomonadota bacterium]
ALVILGLLAGLAVWAQQAPERLVFEDKEAGKVFLLNPHLGEVDLECLKKNVKKLCQAIDNHEVTYLKAIYRLDDPEVRQILSSASIKIQRGGMHTGDAYVLLDKPSQYFFLQQGQDMFAAGQMPPGVKFNTCWKKPLQD